MMPANPKLRTSILALDVGDRRVGVARASRTVRIASPLTTLERGTGFYDDLAKIIETEGVGTIVVGWPRGLDGRQTAQTSRTESFMDQLSEHTNLPIHRQDEALTSHKAKAELDTRGKSYKREEIDALAAAYILEDFLTDSANEKAWS